MINECDCTRGGNCNTITLCKLDNAVEDALNQCEDVIEAAKEYVNLKSTKASSEKVQRAWFGLCDAVDNFEEWEKS